MLLMYGVLIMIVQKIKKENKISDETLKLVYDEISFSFSTPITKSSSDKTQSFRFNLGTTF